MKLFYLGVLLSMLVAARMSSVRGFPQKRQVESAEYFDGTLFTLGTVITPLNESIRTTQAGFYLLPDVIPRAGTVLSLYACAFLYNTTQQIDRFRFFVAPYRLVNDSYSQTASRDVFNIDYTSSNVTQECKSVSVLNLDWYVEQGDRLGVEIPNSCIPNGRLLCPAMPNFIGSAAHYNENFTTDMDNSMIAVDQLEDSNICINIRAVIAPAPPTISEGCHETPTFSPTEATLPTLEVTLGNLKQNLSGLEEFRGGGIYLLPERVPRDGSVVRVSACGFLNTLEFNRSEVDRFRFFLVGVREVENMFELVFTDQVIIFNGETQGCQNTSVSNETVMEGDHIGVYIEHECVQDNGRTVCPAQINVVNRDDCSNQALYYYFPSRVPSILASRFTTLGIGVNIQVTVIGMGSTTVLTATATTMVISTNDPGGSKPIIAIAVGASIGGVTVVVVIVILTAILCARKKDSNLTDPNVDAIDMTATEVYYDYPFQQEKTTISTECNEAYATTTITTNHNEAYSTTTLSDYNEASVTTAPNAAYSSTAVPHQNSEALDTAHHGDTTADEHKVTSSNKVTVEPDELSQRFRNRAFSDNADRLKSDVNQLSAAQKMTEDAPQDVTDDTVYSLPFDHVTSNPSQSLEARHRPHDQHDQNRDPQKESTSLFPASDDYWIPASQEGELRRQLLDLDVPEIKKNTVGVGEYLGSGEFGTVYKGRWTSSSDGEEVREVAMKSLEAGAKEEDRIKFLQEAAIMGQFKHPNIVAILGIITMDEPYMIMTEMMHRGDLCQHLVAFSSECIQRDQAELAAILLSYTRQIGCGMSYLAQKSFIHRDLAARNILVSEKEICKIADFGLSRDLQYSDYYVAHGGKIPVKWTAPEALCYRKYSTASDVWSYGVLLYEIWSLGCKPYTKFTNAEIIKEIMSGYRHPPAPGCPKAIYHLMIECWHPEAASRPTFPQLMLDLQQPDFQLLKWSPEDKAAYSEKAMTLCSPLEEGELLYTDLQLTYSQKETPGDNDDCF